MIKTFKSRYKNPLNRATLGAILSGFGIQGTLIISGVFVARMLGPEGRGHLALLILFPTILTKLGECGISQALVFYISKTPDRVRNIFRKIGYLYPFQSVLLVGLHGGILWLYSEDHSPSVQRAALFTLCVVPGNLARRYGFAILQSQHRFKLFNFLRFLFPISYSFTIVALFLLDSGWLPNVIIWWSILACLSGLISLGLSLHKLPIGDGTRSKMDPTLKEMLQFGLKGLLGTMNPMEAFRIDQLIAGFFISPVALGYYVVAQSFANLPGNIAFSSGTVAYPVIAGHEDKARKIELVWRYWRGITLLNLILVIILVPIIPWLIPFFFGSKFQNSIVIAQVLLSGAFFSASRSILVEGLRGLGYPQISSIAEFAIYPWLLTVGLILVNQYEIIGLAIAVATGYLISLLVALTLYQIKAKKRKGFITSPSEGTPIISYKINPFGK